MNRIAFYMYFSWPLPRVYSKISSAFQLKKGTELSDYFANLTAQSYFAPLSESHLTVCFKTLNFHLLLPPLSLRFNTIP